MCAFLSTSVKEFARFSVADAVLRGLVRQAEVVDANGDGGAAASASRAGSGAAGGPGGAGDRGSPRRSPPAGRDKGDRSPSPPRAPSPPPGTPPAAADGALTLYTRGVPSTAFTLVLQGRVKVRAGTEGFESDLGPWSVLAAKALYDPAYVPDFDAVVYAPARVLRIDAAAYRAALAVGDASAVAAGRAVRHALAGRAGGGGGRVAGPPSGAPRPPRPPPGGAGGGGARGDEAV